MSSIEVFSRTQRIIVNSPSSVRVVNSGPVGPPGDQGIQGPPGDQGVQGPPGEAGASGATYIHTQGSPSDTWVITHNLGFYPSVQVVDSAGTVFLGEVRHDSADQATVLFTAGFSGKAYLS